MSIKPTISYRKMSKEEKRAYHQEYYQKHKEEMKRKTHENYYNNRETRIEQQKENHKRNKERDNARSRAYHHAHKAELNKKQRLYVATHREKIREHRLKRDYGITSEEYDKMFSKQKGLCAICKLPSNKPLYVDHNHKTREVRKLLCGHCNSALGYVKEDTTILKSMIAYIRKHLKGEK